MQPPAGGRPSRRNESDADNNVGQMVLIATIARAPRAASRKQLKELAVELEREHKQEQERRRHVMANQTIAHLIPSALPGSPKDSAPSESDKPASRQPATRPSRPRPAGPPTTGPKPRG